MSLRALLLLCAALAVAGAANPRQLDAVRHFLERRQHADSAPPPPARVVRVFTEPRRQEEPAPQEPTPTPSPWFDCPAMFGLFPDPYDCSSYFQCNYGVPFEEKCQTGLEFNPVSLTCDWPANINPPCQAIPYPTGGAPAAQEVVEVAAAPLIAVQVPEVPQVHVQVPVMRRVLH